MAEIIPIMLSEASVPSSAHANAQEKIMTRVSRTAVSFLMVLQASLSVLPFPFPLIKATAIILL
jgi:hypothetical protein